MLSMGSKPMAHTAGCAFNSSRSQEEPELDSKTTTKGTMRFVVPRSLKTPVAPRLRCEGAASRFANGSTACMSETTESSMSPTNCSPRQHPDLRRGAARCWAMRL
eukprot:scaffold170731_cov24-Tisochrysis_lutea.AAC.1